MEKAVICLLCGGKSTEHEVSLQSGRNVWQALPRDKYEVLVIGIARNGVWYYYGDRECAQNFEDAQKICLKPDGKECALVRTESGVAIAETTGASVHKIDVVFPVLHGANGEDGAVQGLCQMMGVPCVGSDQASSACCMDKDITKKLLTIANIRVAPGLVLKRSDYYDCARIVTEFNLPLFVKPAKTGSSVGITKVKTEEMLEGAIENAFRYDDKILIEKAIVGREIECAVLERADGHLFCPDPGEVILHAEFYSYEAKYCSPDEAELSLPAKIQETEKTQIKEMAKKAFRALGCNGMARIDFFLRPRGGVVLNELNTIPGFTKISFYPMLMQNGGISYPELLAELIEGTRSLAKKKENLYLDIKNY